VHTLRSFGCLCDLALDAAALPSAGAVNTAPTIIALALRAGDHIAGKVAARPAEATPAGALQAPH